MDPQALVERSRKAGKARQAQMSSEERKLLARSGHLRGSINTILRRASEISPEDRQLLLEALTAVDSP